jgi:hypothetical protein
MLRGNVMQKRRSASGGLNTECRMANFDRVLEIGGPQFEGRAQEP